MNQVKILMSVSAAALSLVFSLQPPHPVPFWETNIVIADDDTSPRGNVRAGPAKQGTVLACDKP
jgi:hypothetical protein